MHRIDSPGAVDGRFQNGNPAVGQQATQLTADWFNDMQENMAFAIEAAGIALEKGDPEQLRDAIIALVAGAVGTGGGAVPTTRLVNSTGLLSGGGPLAADLTLDVPKASAVEILAGTIDTKAITPLGLATASASTLSNNGYIKLPGGLILQWGGLTGSYAEGSVAVTFPIAFPNACFRAFPVAVNQTATPDHDVFIQRVAQTTSGATFFFNYDGGGTNAINGLDYFAIGN